MPLIEALTLEVGASIAKSLLKRWLNNDDVISDAGASIIDILKTGTSDRVAQKRAQRQFEAIGEKVGESLLPVFEVEGAGFDDATRTAIAMAVAETLNTATSEVLAKRNLEPRDVAKQLLQEHPARSYHFSETEGHLYECIITEACEDIVDIASQLPQFTEKTLAEILKREGELTAIAERILQEVTRLRAELDPKVEGARFELAYRRAVIRRLDELELFGAGVSVTSRRYSLSLAYIALSLEEQVTRPRHPDPRSGQGHSFPEEKADTEVIRSIISVNELLSKARYLLIRGDAGSGKSTLLQWIAVQAAAQSFPQPLASFNAMLPFYIRLRQHIPAGLSTPSWPAPELFPTLVAPSIAGTMPHGWVHRQLDQGHALVLVDGIDEVPEAARASMYAWLKDLLIEFPRASFVVTSRPYALAKDELQAEGFKDAALLPLTPPAIEMFIDQWYTAIAANVQQSEEQVQLLVSAKRLKEEIRKAHAKRALATNPLLCAMLCALNYERHQQLPSDRITLYEACCELLIERRDKERDITLSEYPAAALLYTQKSLLLADLAYWFIRNGWSEAAREEVDKRLTRRLSRMQGVQHMLGADARLFFIQRSGMLREPIVGAVDFAHRTFQEFLAAKAAVDEGDIGVLVQHAHDDQWREMVQLAAGLATSKVREDLAERLIGRGETEKSYRAQLYLLAAACAQASQEEVGISTKLRIERRLKALTPFQSAEEALAMAASGELALPYLHPNLYHTSEVAAACVQSLIKIGSEAALAVLEKYKNDFTSSVQNALVLGLRDIDEKAIYARRFLSHIERLSWSTEVENLHYLPLLTSLSLYSLKVSDWGFLAHLPQLTSLRLDNLQVIDWGFLAHLPQLTSLTLYNLKGIDWGFLAHLPQLTSLTLYNLKGSDWGFLAHLPQLTSLTLWKLQGSDWGFLAHLPQLTSLTLYELQVSDWGFLAQLPHLTSLTLYNLQGSDWGFLAQLPQLTSLTLYNLKVSYCGFLAQLPQLISLTLYELQVSDWGFLAQIPQLTSLTLSDLQGSDWDFLAHLPHLTSLTLYNLQGSDWDFLAHLPQLISLTLYNLQGSDWDFLAHLPQLISLTLYELQVSDWDFLAHLPHLTSLSLSSLQMVRQSGSLYLPQLTKLIHD